MQSGYSLTVPPDCRKAHSLSQRQRRFVPRQPALASFPFAEIDSVVFWCLVNRATMSNPSALGTLASRKSANMSERLPADALKYLREALDDPRAGFRPSQFQAIEQLVVERSRVLVVQRTGWGKSLVYFIATRLLRDRGAGPTMLISPLLALMRNQIRMAENIGLRAYTVNSTNREEWDEVEAALERDEVDLLLVSPERLANEQFQERVLSELAGRVGLFVVDEVHCISDWGHDFRPDYRRISRILQFLPRNVPVLGTTATANDRVIADVQEQLGEELVILRGPIKRESLRLQNIQLPTQAARMAWLAEHVSSMPGSGIIYTLTIRDAQNVAEWLRSRGIEAQAYWGGLDHESRIDLEQRLLDNDVKALVATTALGMGYDKPDLGFVIHFQRPGSVIHYYQQIGRAGRALPDAFAVLLCGEEDETITSYFLETAFPAERHVDEVLHALRESDDGLTVSELQRQINLSRGQIDKVLKRLATESPAPVSLGRSRWRATPVHYEPDQNRIEQITALRYAEQEQMQEYMESQRCLMAFLEDALGVVDPEPCGRCAVCAGEPLLPLDASRELAAAAHEFLGTRRYEISPRRQWASPGISELGYAGNIAEDLRHETGRALSQWRDSGWGEMVYTGKFVQERFPQQLVRASAELIQERWLPEPAPEWVTCVPSLHRPELVPDFAARLAEELGIPFYDCLSKRHATYEQKSMRNSFQQLTNIAGSIELAHLPMPGKPVLLVDDIVDSRWTLTVAAVALRKAGSGPVFPFALTAMFGS
jgi:ATP-dependent DNA helicase RecQ